MIFGTVFTGHIKTQEKQWIESKVFCLGIPLYVTNTMLVTDVTGSGRRGIEIKTNSTSIAAAIIRPIVTVAWIFSVGAFIANYDEMFWLSGPALIFTALFVYSWFFFGKTTKDERFIRKQFGITIRCFILCPTGLNLCNIQSYLDKLKEVYLSHFDTTDWKERLKNLPYEDKAFTICFCMTALENAIAWNAETAKMLDDITAQHLDKLG